MLMITSWNEKHRKIKFDRQYPDSRRIVKGIQGSKNCVEMQQSVGYIYIIHRKGPGSRDGDGDNVIILNFHGNSELPAPMVTFINHNYLKLQPIEFNVLHFH